MYTPKQHEETRIDVMHQLIHSQPLGTWAALGDSELLVNHVPFQLDPSRGEFGTLVGHVARANPVWQVPSTGVLSVVAFQGPQSYITPSWYPSKHEHGKAVPTWNYVVVHACGTPIFVQNRDWLLAHVNSLTSEHESGQAVPWAVSDAPADFTERLVGMIVGVEIPIQRLTGKWKTNQNRPDPDKLGVVAGLLSKGDPQSKAMASLVRQHIAP